MNVSLEHASLKYQRWQGKEIAQQLTTFPLLTRPCARIILCVMLRFVAIVVFILQEKNIYTYIWIYINA